MKSVNRVVLLGNIGQTPDVKFSANGTAVAKVSLATNERYKDSSGQWAERTEWHSLVFWAKLAELVQQYVMKGSKIYVEGRLSTSSWDDKNTGEKKYRTEIIVNDLVLLDGKQDAKKDTEEDSTPF